MTTDRRRSDLNIDRNRLFKRMMAAKDSGNKQEINDALVEGAAWLRNTYGGDTAMRDAQRQLQRALRLGP